MPVAVTGGIGFLGLNFVRGLLAENASIVVLARGEYASAQPPSCWDSLGRRQPTAWTRTTSCTTTSC
jgi:nucleoside-diphosphate-sugar epimerase